MKEAVRNVKRYLAKSGMKLKRKAGSPITPNYSPEIDSSEELNGVESTYYQSLIGILRWMVEMGRIDISTEVSMLSSYVAMTLRTNVLYFLISEDPS